MIKKLLALTALTIANVSFASTNLDLHFINLTPHAGKAILGAVDQLGPDIGSGTGDSVAWSPTLDNDAAKLVGIMYADGYGDLCISPSGTNLILNASLWQNDPITITFVQADTRGGVICSCVGSACDISAENNIRRTL